MKKILLLNLFFINTVILGMDKEMQQIFGFDGKKFYTKNVPAKKHHKIGSLYDNKLLLAQKKLCQNKFDDGFKCLGEQKYKQALSNFEFGLKLAQEIPFDSCIYFQSYDVVKAIANIYVQIGNSEQAIQLLQDLVDRGYDQACIPLAALLEKKKTNNNEEYETLKKKIKSLYAHVAASGDKYAKSCYAQYLEREDKTKLAVRDFIYLLENSTDKNALNNSIHALYKYSNKGNFLALSSLLAYYKKINFTQKQLSDIFTQFVDQLEDYSNKENRNTLNLKTIATAIQNFEHKIEGELIGRAYYALALLVADDYQDKYYAKAHMFFRKSNSAQALMYQMNAYINGNGIESSMPRMFGCFSKLDELNALPNYFNSLDNSIISILKKYAHSGGKKSAYASYVLARYYTYKDSTDLTCIYEYYKKALAAKSPLASNTRVRFNAALARFELADNVEKKNLDIIELLRPVLAQKIDELKGIDLQYYEQSYVMLAHLMHDYGAELIKNKAFDVCYKLSSLALYSDKITSYVLAFLKDVEYAIKDSDSDEVLSLIKTSGTLKKLGKQAHSNNLPACNALSMVYLLRAENARIVSQNNHIKCFVKGLFYFKKLLDIQDSEKSSYQENIVKYCEYANKLACIYWKNNEKKLALEYWNRALKYDNEAVFCTMLNVTKFLTQPNDIPQYISNIVQMCKQYINNVGLNKFPASFLEFFACIEYDAQDGFDIKKRDKCLAFKYATVAAEQHGVTAHRLLGDMYKNGIKNDKGEWFIEPNQSQALFHYSKSIAFAQKQGFFNGNGYFQRAKFFYEQRKYNEALKDFDYIIQAKQIQNKQTLYLAHWYKGTILLEQGNKKDAFKFFNTAFKLIDKNGDFTPLIEIVTPQVLLYLEERAKVITNLKRDINADLAQCYNIGCLLYEYAILKQKEDKNNFKDIGLFYLTYAAEKEYIWAQYYLGLDTHQSIPLKKRYSYLWQVFNNVDSAYLQDHIVQLYKKDAQEGYFLAMVYLLNCYAKNKKIKEIETFLALLQRDQKCLAIEYDDRIFFNMLTESGAIDILQNIIKQKKMNNNFLGANLMLGCIYTSYVEPSDKKIVTFQNAIQYLTLIKNNMGKKDGRLHGIKCLLNRAYYSLGLCFEKAGDIKHAFQSWKKILKEPVGLEAYIAQKKIFEGVLDGICDVPDIHKILYTLSITALQVNDSEGIALLARYYLEKTYDQDKGIALLEQAKKMGYNISKIANNALKKVKSASAMLDPKQEIPEYFYNNEQTKIKQFSEKAQSNESNNKEYRASILLEEKGKYKKASQKLFKLARNSHPNACIRLSSYYYLGKGKQIKRNIPLALEYLKKGLDNGGLLENKKYLDYDIAFLIFNTIDQLLKRANPNDESDKKILGMLISFLTSKEAPVGLNKGDN